MVTACMSLETVDMLNILPITISYSLSEYKQNQKAWSASQKLVVPKETPMLPSFSFLMWINSDNIKTEH